MKFWTLLMSTTVFRATTLSRASFSASQNATPYGLHEVQQSIPELLLEEQRWIRQKRLPNERYHFVKCMAEDSDEVATCEPIKDGISYLTQDSKKNSIIDLDAGSCTRVSCSWNSEIQLCNQGNLHNKTSMEEIGKNAQEILDQCKQYLPEVPTYFVRGVLWDMGDTWDTQTYVGYDSC
ncbi:hypothetical protein SUNI508_08226 [Seiridium unicorne]|uniref:Uncharacterized protein n=1 Tax=Seiridium unicorne TaxID=138068 RepID=A0ABR2UUC0_9PEZI